MTKELLFSLTKKDFKIETFRSGGKGGQHQNTTDSGVRIKHPESGSVGECRNNRSQLQNKREAFRRLAASSHFKSWMRLKVGSLIEEETIEERVEKQMAPENLKVEIRDDDNIWKEFEMKLGK